MTSLTALQVHQLYQACDPELFRFRSTEELEDLGEMIGQLRAMDAVRFGAGIRHEGYNIFALGPSGLGKRTMVHRYLEKKASSEPGPDDWCYVNNFAQPHMPRALRLPAGRGTALRVQMEQLVDYLQSAIPALFESDEYRDKIGAIQEEFSKQQEVALGELENDAHQQEVVLLRTPGGFAFAPTHFHEIMPPEEYNKLPEEERKQIEEKIAGLQERLEKILRRLPQWHKERSERIKQLNRDTILSAVEHAMNEVRTMFNDLPQVLSYLDIVQLDVIEHADDFRRQEEPSNTGGLTLVMHEDFRRYQVNVLVTNGTHSGALVTDFTLIKPGALHRANGGYLLLDVREVLMQPFAWEGLKRALKSREIHIESLGQAYSLISTVSLEPEPIPLNAKIVVFGDRLFYYLLQEYDPEFRELFKVAADFEERIERNADTHMLYARMIATLIRQEALLPFERGAVARVIEHGARLVGDGERLSTHMGSVKDLLRESDYWAREEGRNIVLPSHVQRSIDTQIRRQDRLRDRMHEEILRNTLMISTDGAVTGQINGLSVIELGGFAFAQPTRITATTRLGEGELINIEREVKLSGAIHSKGVLILSSFLSSRYARNQPMALSASLVFEQSYGMIDGDSASMAELCALLSSLAGLPIRQSLAITGSVNQLGQAQPIGAVNEKIEGFFDICAARGLNGEHGVLIPAANVKHLMLRHDVVAAVEAGQFRIHAYENVDQAVSILTGVPAGAAGPGGYPEGSVNYKVALRVAELTEVMQSFSRRQGDGVRQKKSDKGE
ncbi:Lon protease family protein [Noviherbaspirillum sp.]|uniref:Lon protease family protein n=1 Tax=Noviherbaspirillum sp. TaxID=1926288 RepID=UPI002B48F6E1|nr:AAA family ATPase [Noviherbaspirillum sp.]HJV80467.1 AAA family ATPase [Noviherbaspirillum sp.]